MPIAIILKLLICARPLLGSSYDPCMRHVHTRPPKSACRPLPLPPHLAAAAGSSSWKF